MKRRARTTGRGFTLLELLVAIAIMAISLGMLYQSTGSSARHIGNIELQQRAAALAESILSLREVIPAEGWRASGESAEFAWRVETLPFPTTVTALNAAPLHELTVEIVWSAGSNRRSLSVQTLKPQRKPLPGEASP